MSAQRRRLIGPRGSVTWLYQCDDRMVEIGPCRNVTELNRCSHRMVRKTCKVLVSM